VILICSGKGGVGKTTTIGKIGKILKNNGSKVIFAASDTFRAAAIEQLENWASKVDVQIVKSSQGADPASVAFKAMEIAQNQNINQVIVDTAGRLQNKKNLMDELKKIGVTHVSFTGPLQIEKCHILGKGYVGMVVLAKKNNEIVALKIRRIDSPRKNMSNEAKLLQIVNKLGIGPKFIKNSKNLLIIFFTFFN